MKKIPACVSACFALLFCLVPAALFAEIVSEVSPDGVMALEDGKKVSLAGVQMDAEGASVLRVLTSKQDVRIEILKTVRDQKGGECAYAYLKAKSIKMPFKNAEVTGEEEVLLNEFLLELGAAKVDATQDFAKKSRFLAIEEKAKKKGEGVWSYVGS